MPPKTQSQKIAPSEDQSSGRLDSISAELVRARVKMGLSQTELAERASISRNTLMGYESGRNKPGARELRSLCEVLKVSPNQILFGTEQPFKKDGSRSKYALNGEGAEISVQTVMLSMLANDEKAAIFTLVQGLLEARHGTAIHAQIALVKGAIDNLIKDPESHLEKALDGAMPSQSDLDNLKSSPRKRTAKKSKT